MQEYLLQKMQKKQTNRLVSNCLRKRRRIKENKLFLEPAQFKGGTVTMTTVLFLGHSYFWNATTWYLIQNKQYSFHN